MPTTEERLSDLEALVAQALSVARHHGDEHTELGFDPAILKQRQIIGWLGLARSSADLTLTTSSQDVAGCTLTLPHVGEYAIDAVFDFDYTAVPSDATDATASGVLADSADNEETGVAHFTVPSLDSLDSFRATVGQQWSITTTAKDTVYKLRARKSAAVAGETIKALATHTTIRALYVGRAVA
jgi:hypothetical protein